MKRSITPLLCLGLPCLLVGCGGHGSGSSSSAVPATKGGRAVLTVKWPAASRLVPTSAASLVVALTKADGAPVATQRVERPPAGTATTSTAFSGLPYGDLRVAIEARPNEDGTGVVQATGAGTLRVVENAPAAVEVALGSTVAKLSIAPATINVAAGKTVTLVASATDASGAIVLLAANGRDEPIAWSCDDPTLDSVVGNGPTAVLTNLGPGSPHVTATLTTTDGGATVASLPVTVNVVSFALSVAPAATFTYGTTQGGFTGPIGPALAQALFGARRIPCTVGLSPTASTDTSVALACTGPVSFAPNSASTSSSLALPANTGSATLFGFYATHVDTDATATITAATVDYGAATGSVLVKANPLASVVGSAVNVQGGGNVTGNVTLGLYALSEEKVSLACADPSVTLPASVSVPGPVYHPQSFDPFGNPIPGSAYHSLSKTASFTVGTSAVTAPKTVTITATRAGVTKSFDLTITP